MAYSLTPSGKNERYEEILAQATVYPPISIFDDAVEGKKGIYRLNGGKVRTLLVADVERKRRELAGLAVSPEERI